MHVETFDHAVRFRQPTLPRVQVFSYRLERFLPDFTTNPFRCFPVSSIDVVQQTRLYLGATLYIRSFTLSIPIANKIQCFIDSRM